MFRKYKKETLTNDMLGNWFPNQDCFIMYNYDNNQLQYGGELGFATKSTYGIFSYSKQKINEGKLSKEKINQTANLLSPYLNEQQKDMLKNLIGKIDV